MFLLAGIFHCLLQPLHSLLPDRTFGKRRRKRAFGEHLQRILQQEGPACSAAAGRALIAAISLRGTDDAPH